MNVHEAIQAAERILPGTPASSGNQDPRWQAIIAVGEHIEDSPEQVWQFTVRWGSHPDPDLRNAVATCLLEHLLEYHFELLFPRVEKAAMAEPLFADTFLSCWQFGEPDKKSKRMRELAEACQKRLIDLGLE